MTAKNNLVRITRPRLAGILAIGLAAAFAQEGRATDKLRFAVGPLQPTPTETKKAYDPFFKYLADQLGANYTLEATTDWAGIAGALMVGDDVAWMGPGATSSPTIRAPATRLRPPNTTASRSTTRSSSLAPT